METDMVFNLQTNFVRGLQIGFSLTKTGDPLGFLKDLEKYRSATADDIRRVAEKYFVMGNRSVVKLLPKEE
jgi:predicted Zn-dependent peptidase